MTNHWLSSNKTSLERIRKILIGMEYLPIFQDYPVRTVQGLFNGFEAEVNRLQNENDKLKTELEKLKKNETTI